MQQLGYSNLTTKRSSNRANREGQSCSVIPPMLIPEYPLPISRKKIQPKSIWFSQIKKASCIGVAMLLSSCAALDIGHNSFYCQDNPSSCKSASKYLSNDLANKQNQKSVDLKTLQLKTPTSSQVMSAADNLTHPSTNTVQTTLVQPAKSEYQITNLQATNGVAYASGISSNSSRFSLINSQANSYIKVWVAPWQVRDEIYPSTYLIVPYIAPKK